MCFFTLIPIFTHSLKNYCMNYHLRLILFLFLSVVPTIRIYAVSLKVVSAADAMALPNSEVAVDVTVVNESYELVMSVDYVVFTNKVRSQEMHVVFSEGLDIYADEFVLPLSISSPEETGIVSKQISITKVNGLKNEAINTKADFNLYTVTQLEARKVVMEEYTGLWCGFCPKGEAAMNRIEDEYGDRFIGISIHSDDVIELLDYKKEGLMSETFPKATLQREQFYIDPYLGTIPWYTEICPIRHDVDRLLNMPAEASVELTPVWNDESHPAILPSAKVIFRFNSSKARYAIGYILLADSLTGTGKTWSQANYYYKDEDYRRWFQGDPYMDEFIDAEENVVYNNTNYIPDYICRRVAVATMGLRNGIANSIPSQINADETITFDHVIDATSNSIQDKNRLSVVALLFNVNTGVIVNAALAKVGTVSSVLSPESRLANENQMTCRYNLGGLLLQKPVKGINIIRMGDGSVKKVVER